MRSVIRTHRSRDGEGLTVVLNNGTGFTLWRRGALSLLWRGNVGLQFVLGDWWKAHPEVKA